MTEDTEGSADKNREHGTVDSPGVLAAAFLAAGAMKLARPRHELQENMELVEDFSDSTIKAIGAVEVLGALGLILPAALDTSPILVPMAAVGLASDQALAAGVHFRRSEAQMIPINVVLLAVAAFIAWGRFGDYSF